MSNITDELRQLTAENKQLQARVEELEARWNYIKTDIEGARALLLLLLSQKGTPDDFDTIIDRIILSCSEDK